MEEAIPGNLKMQGLWKRRDDFSKAEAFGSPGRGGEGGQTLARDTPHPILHTRLISTGLD